MKNLQLILWLTTAGSAACFTPHFPRYTANPRITGSPKGNSKIISFRFQRSDDSLLLYASTPIENVRNATSTTSTAASAETSTFTSTSLGKALEADPSPTTNTKQTAFPIVLWKFSRPHTLIGSALAIPALQILAAPSFQAALSTPNLVAAVFAMIPSLLMNLYITGLNQITDVEIDKINKPNLPIVTGELSMKTAIITVMVALLLSLSMGLSHPVLGSQGLNVALWGSGILGTMYSLPPFRLKRFPLLAAFCIVAVRGTIINAGFFAHARAAAFGVPSATVFNCLFGDLKCGLSSLFFGVFGIVIALMKDVPDVRGDKLSNVRTFSVRIGQKRIFHAMRKLLMGLFFVYGAAFIRGAVMAPSALLATFRGAVGVASVAAGLSVRKEAQGVDPEDPKQVYGFYMHLWKLFYLSYLALPFVR